MRVAIEIKNILHIKQILLNYVCPFYQLLTLGCCSINYGFDYGYIFVRIRV